MIANIASNQSIKVTGGVFYIATYINGGGGSATSAFITLHITSSPPATLSVQSTTFSLISSVQFVNSP